MVRGPTVTLAYGLEQLLIFLLSCSPNFPRISKRYTRADRRETFFRDWFCTKAYEHFNISNNMQIQWPKNNFFCSFPQIMLSYCFCLCFACAPFRLCRFCLLKPGFTNIKALSMAQDNPFTCDLFRLDPMHLFKTFCPLWEKTHVRLNKLVVDQIFFTLHLPFELPSALILY